MIYMIYSMIAIIMLYLAFSPFYYFENDMENIVVWHFAVLILNIIVCCLFFDDKIVLGAFVGMFMFAVGSLFASVAKL